MKNFRRIITLLILVLSFAFALSFTGISEVHADDHTHSYTEGICTHDGCGQCSGLHATGWTELTSTTLSLNGGKYYLEDDVCLKAGNIITISGTVTICLNGHVLCGGAYGQTDSSSKRNVITINSGATLNITDCNSTLSSATKTTHHFSDQDGLWVWDKNELATAHLVYGGVITGGNNGTAGGGAIIVQGTGILNIYSGNFIGNQTALLTGSTNRYNGGVIYAQKGTIRIYGGRFAGNMAENGGVFYLDTSGTNNPKFYLYGGILENNIAFKNGGALFSISGKTSTFYIYGGTITNNIANKGYKGGHGGGIVYNSNIYFGGNPVIQNNITVEKINNVEVSNTENVYIYSSKPIKFDSITPKEGMSVGITIPSELPITNNNIQYDYMDFTIAYPTSYKNYFSSDNVVYKIKDYYDGDKKTYTLRVSLPLHSHSDGAKFDTELTNDLINSTDGKEAGELKTGNYYLDSDITLTNTIKIKDTSKVKICLNNCELKGSGTGNVIDVEAGGSLTIYDCGDTKKYFIDSDSNGSYETLVSTANAYSKEVTGGYITGGVSTANGGSCINVSGTLNMLGGTLVGNEQSNTSDLGGGTINISNGGYVTINGGSIIGNVGENGGAINISDGTSKSTLIINDCTIEKNTARNYGGAIYSSSENTVTIYKGTYSANTASEAGGAIYTTSDASLYIKNGTFNENSTSGCGGAIYANNDVMLLGGNFNNNFAIAGAGVYIPGSNNGDIEIAGSIRIENNYGENGESNLFLSNEVALKKITIGVLEGARIGISSELSPEYGAVSLSDGNAIDNSSSFFSDSNDYKIVNVVENDLNVLKLVDKLSVKYHSDLHNTGTWPEDNTEYIEGQTVTIKGNDNNLARKGYKFLGWNTDSSATEALTGTLTITSDIDLYAIWQEKIEIVFDTTQQIFVYNAGYGKFIPDHELKESFTIWYFVDDTQTLNGATEVGVYKIRIVRAEDQIYKGYDKTLEEGLKIVSKEITPTFGKVSDKTFTRSAITLTTSELRVFDESTELVLGKDYTVEYANNINAGYNAQAIVTCMGNYSGTATKEFTINPKQVTPNVDNMETAYYSPTGSTPGVTVLDDDFPLDRECDYDIEYSNNTQVGTGHLVVTLKGNYIGTNERDFTINQKSTTPTIDDIDSQVYTGNEIRPAINVYDGQVLLISGTDYDVQYSDNIKVGTATVSVTLKGNYSGTASKDFEIVPKQLTVTWNDLEFVYDGSAHKPSAVLNGVINGDTVEIVVSGEQTNVGTYTATASFVEEQTNYIFADNVNPTTNFEITIATTVITDLTIEGWTYGGTPNAPTANTNFGEIVYTYSSEENGDYFSTVPTAAGTYYVKASVAETTNYTYAESKVQFAIAKKQVICTPCANNFTYNGQSQAGSLSATYKPISGEDKALKVKRIYQFDTTNTDFKNAGTWYVEFTFVTDAEKNNYSFSGKDYFTASFNMMKASYNMNNAHWEYSEPYTYTGNVQGVYVAGLPEGVTVKEYTDNEKTNAGSYTAKVTFNYDASNYNEVTLDDCNWVINKATYDVTQVSWDYDEPYTYNGNAQTVELKDLPQGVTVKYKNNSATVVGEYFAEIEEYYYDTQNYNEPTVIQGKTWEIVKADYDMSNVAWNYNNDLVYDGNEKTVELKNLPNGVTANYDGNSYTEAGDDYEASVVSFNYDTHNYNEPVFEETCLWEIQKATYNMDNVTWTYNSDEPFVYDGTAKTIEVINLPEGVEVGYVDCSKTEADNYTGQAYVSSYDEANYNEPESIPNCSWSILKAKIDINNVTWNYNSDEPFVYDGKTKTVELKNLPELLSVTYNNNSYDQAGEYKASVNEFNYDTVNYEIDGSIDELQWEILKATYDMQNAHWNYDVDHPFVYDGLEKTVEFVGLPTGVTVKAYNGNTGTIVDSYAASVELDYDTSNYNEIIVSSLSWSINKADYNMNDVTWVYENNFTYDGEAKSVTVTGLPTGVTVNAYENNSKIEAGSYIAKVLEFNYDTFNYNAPVYETTCSWEIKKATYNMSDVAWNIPESIVYDGNSHTVEVTGLPNGVSVKTYENNSKTNAGSYVAKVLEFDYDTTNYNAPVFETVGNWSIAKATYNMDNVKWNYSTPYTYDGSEKKVEVINLPQGVTVSKYVDNAKTTAGSYTAQATLSYDTANYNEISVSDCKWTISLAKYDMSNVKWNYTSAITFDGTSKKVELTGLPTGVSASYTNNVFTNVGKYKAEVTLTYDTANYEQVTFNALNWEIVKADYDMSNVKWNYTEAFTYDGTTKTVELTNLPNGVSATYSGNSNTNAGSYEATATLSYDTANYNAPTVNNCNWIINKTKHDMSNAKWNYVTPFTYDGKVKTVEYINLPEGVTVESYAGNSNINAGSYVASVTLAYDTANYESIVVSELTWEIKKADYVINVKFDSLTIPQDEAKHMINVVGNIPSGVTVKYYSNDVEFAGSSEVGSYEVVAKFFGDYNNYNEIEDMNATLTIQATQIVVPVEEGKELPEVLVEAENGFPADVTVSVTVYADSEETKQESSFDYEGNKDKETKLKFDEEVGFVFEISLMREVNGEMVPVQPSELDGVSTVKVKILIPEDIDIKEITRIIHVHNDNDVTEIEFDADKVDENRYYEIEISKFSEFAFIHKKDCSSHWGLIIILAIYIAFVVIWVFVLKNYKFDFISIGATVVYGGAWLGFVFFACCFKCIIFAVIDFIVLLVGVMLLGTNGATNLASFLFAKKEEEQPEPVNEHDIGVLSLDNKSNKEELKKFKEHETVINNHADNYEEKKLNEMFEHAIKDNVLPDEYNGEDKIEVAGIIFANGKKVYKCIPNGKKVNVGDKVVVEGDAGKQTGIIVHANYYTRPNNIARKIVSVLKK